MSENEDRAWGQYADSVPVDRALAVFSGVQPYTTREVAAAMNATEHTARAALEALHERGDVGRKQVRGDPATLTVWYRTRTSLDGAGEDASDEGLDVDARVDEFLAEEELPGTSEMMRDWRRDAVRATFDHLRERGEVTAPQLKDVVFPRHEAGFDDPDAWWEMVRSRLKQLPGVVDPAWGGSTWRYEGP